MAHRVKRGEFELVEEEAAKQTINCVSLKAPCAKKRERDFILASQLSASREIKKSIERDLRNDFFLYFSKHFYDMCSRGRY